MSKPPQERKSYELDVPDLINLICGKRAETFPFERLLGVLTFSVWNFWPDEPEIVLHGRTVAAASLFQILRSTEARRLGKKASAAIDGIGQNLLRPEIVAAFLPYPIDFESEIVRKSTALSQASYVVAYFVASAVQKERPSLNKALHFIESGGGGKDWKMSRAAMKNYWVSCAVSAPFMYAQQYLGTPKLVGLCSDVGDDIFEAHRLLRKKHPIIEFFGIAKKMPSPSCYSTQVRIH